MLQDVITQVEEILEEPAFKKFDEKMLTSYVLESLPPIFRTMYNRNILVNSVNYLMDLEVASTYIAAAEGKNFMK